MNFQQVICLISSCFDIVADDIAGELQHSQAILKASLTGILHLWNRVCAVADSSVLHLVHRRDEGRFPLQ